MTQSPDRRSELESALRRVRARIADACAAAGRRPDEVVLVVVTKTWPASDVRLLAGLGVADVGENRDQEAAPKAAACAGFPECSSLRWHFVGQLQTNKAGSVAAYAAAVHSVDRPRLVQALDRGAERAGRELAAFVQVDLDAAAAAGGASEAAGRRGGAAPDDVPALADAVAASAHLRLAGVMAVAPPDEDPAAAFARLHDLSLRVRAAHPAATGISAGMSGDLEAAIAAGATHVRVGAAVLGTRDPAG